MSRDTVPPTVFAVVTFTLPDGISEAIRGRLAQTQSVVSRETGCVLYRFSTDLLDQGLVRLVEHWRDQEAFDAHVAKAHSAEFLAWLQAVGMQGFTLQQHDVQRSAEPLRIGD